MSRLIELLKKNGDLADDKFKEIIQTELYDEEIFAEALKLRERYYGKDVYIRGLIEISSYCKNDCYYCGIRRSNTCAQRYRLTEEEILFCCRKGYELGFRTFVLQGGEDTHFTDERICSIVRSIRKNFPDCAITLSLGEKSKEAYQAFYESGADRYLLRHETADEKHYEKLHPSNLSLSSRKKCLWDLKEIGYQVGSGFMVGSPYQTADNLIEDIRFLQKLKPDMVGIGPYISHKDTPFSGFKNGNFKLTLRMIGIIRIIFPDILIPSTTALGTISERGRELGLLAGANVLMPNLSPARVRGKYSLYDNKICTGMEAAEYKDELEERVRKIGFNIVTDRGDRRKET